MQTIWPTRWLTPQLIRQIKLQVTHCRLTCWGYHLWSAWLGWQRITLPSLPAPTRVRRSKTLIFSSSDRLPHNKLTQLTAVRVDEGGRLCSLHKESPGSTRCDRLTLFVTPIMSHYSKYLLQEQFSDVLSEPSWRPSSHKFSWRVCKLVTYWKLIVLKLADVQSHR